MLDINSILNGKSKKKSKQKSFLDSLRGKGNPNPSDRVTKKQKPFLQSKSYRKRFRDNDKDGVINALDCQPNNKRKHGTYYRGIDSFEKKLFEVKGKLEPRRYKKDKPNRIWVTPKKEIAQRYGKEVMEIEIDDNKVKKEQGRSRMLYTEDEVWPSQVKSIHSPEDSIEEK